MMFNPQTLNNKNISSGIIANNNSPTPMVVNESSKKSSKRSFLLPFSVNINLLIGALVLIAFTLIILIIVLLSVYNAFVQVDNNKKTTPIRQV